MFQETYRHMNDALTPSTALREETLSNLDRRPRRAANLPRRVLALAAAAALCLSTTALAAQTEPGYRLLYAVAPAVAQFFQPVQRSCTAGGVTMEVVAVRVDGDTAQAYIALTGGAVDETTDLFDSYNFHLPDHQIGHCERVSYDEATHTATFLCTTKTMDGRPIRPGGKMTFSLDRFLSGKESVENLAVDLDLSSYAADAETTPVWGTQDEIRTQKRPDGAYFRGGGGYSDQRGESLLATSTMLLPGPALTTPAAGIPITAAGYADGLFHVQVELQNRIESDVHCWLWLEDDSGNRVERVYAAYFRDSEDHHDRREFYEAVFDIPPADLPNYTLCGDFYTSRTFTEGPWRITFPLETT